MALTQDDEFYDDESLMDDRKSTENTSSERNDEKQFEFKIEEGKVVGGKGKLDGLQNLTQEPSMAQLFENCREELEEPYAWVRNVDGTEKLAHYFNDRNGEKVTFGSGEDPN